jgi:type 1 glutamine amidotransferase
MEAAKPFLQKIAKENNFIIDISDDSSLINDKNLSRYDVFIPLHLAPFDISYSQQDALQRFIEGGKGWVGIHAAGLTGKMFIKPERKYWQWFEDFLGGVEYSPHPAFQRGVLQIEDSRHPVTRNLPARFEIPDEWYEFDKSPRGHVRILATADESTYKQKKTMGDHPLIWTNEQYKRTVYIGVGHSPELCNDPNFAILIRDAILWAAGKTIEDKPRFRVLVLAEASGHHVEYSKRAMIWLDKLAVDSNFRIDYIENTDKIDEDYLKKYKLFIQLDYPPYGWKPKAGSAFEKYIQKGKIGWIGFHHATLLGEFDGYPIWPWFQQFMGGIRFKDYIADFADGKVEIEIASHPIMKGVSTSFVINKEEWYTYDKSPRPNVQVLARVDESSYQPPSEKKMGDHPVIWTNTKMKARNVYIFMGHGPWLFDNENYCKIFKNAIFWTKGN